MKNFEDTTHGIVLMYVKFLVLIGGIVFLTYLNLK